MFSLVVLILKFVLPNHLLLALIICSLLFNFSCYICFFLFFNEFLINFTMWEKHWILTHKKNNETLQSAGTLLQSQLPVIRSNLFDKTFSASMIHLYDTKLSLVVNIICKLKHIWLNFVFILHFWYMVYLYSFLNHKRVDYTLYGNFQFQ